MMTNPSLTRLPLTRRNFLRTTAASTAFLIVPSLRGADAPNNKLNLAGIGIGGQGAHDLQQLESQNIVALCDIDQAHAARVYKKYPNAKRFTDYRKMLDEVKEIDGVVVATPDHHHAFASMEAIRRGKHVYCEKPLTHSVWEARELAKAARAAKVATQMGNQGQASSDHRRLCELVWNGVVGPIREVHIWTDRPSRGLFDEYWPQGVGRPSNTPPVPSTLDWDLFIGPAPHRPYHPIYTPFKWRGWWDFGTGALGDIGCHAMDPIFRALKFGGPVSVQGASTRVNGDTYPLGSVVTYHFAARTAEPQRINTHISGLSGKDAGAVEMPACKLVWYDGGLRPPRPEALPDGVRMGEGGHLLVGDKGIILGSSVYPETCASEARSVRSVIPQSIGHHEEWVRACKGGAPAGSNFDFAGPLSEAVLLGNVALRVQLREDLTLSALHWDSANLKVSNLEEANKFIRREYRAGWKLV